MKNNMIAVYCFFILGLISIPLRNHFFNDDKKSLGVIYGNGFYKSNYPKSLIMLISIDRHAEKYNIPKEYAFGIAYNETTYKGPMDFNYNPERISSAGALGPMQIMPSTAEMIWGEKIPKDKLLSDIDFNVETSMILLRKLHDRYKNWKIVFGYYNTGNPCINEYAERVYNFKPSNI